jgi:hypothetical protein
MSPQNNTSQLPLTTKVGATLTSRFSIAVKIGKPDGELIESPVKTMASGRSDSITLQAFSSSLGRGSL